jgi:hypothetical protein
MDRFWAVSARFIRITFHFVWIYISAYLVSKSFVPMIANRLMEPTTFVASYLIVIGVWIFLSLGGFALVLSARDALGDVLYVLWEYQHCGVVPTVPKSDWPRDDREKNVGWGSRRVNGSTRWRWKMWAIILRGKFIYGPSMMKNAAKSEPLEERLDDVHSHFP